MNLLNELIKEVFNYKKQQEGLTQAKLAKRINSTQTTVGRWLNGELNIKFEYLKSLSRELDIPYDILIRNYEIDILYDTTSLQSLNDIFLRKNEQKINTFLQKEFQYIKEIKNQDTKIIIEIHNIISSIINEKNIKKESFINLFLNKKISIIEELNLLNTLIEIIKSKDLKKAYFCFKLLKYLELAEEKQIKEYELLIENKTFCKEDTSLYEKMILNIKEKSIKQLLKNLEKEIIDNSIEYKTSSNLLEKRNYKKETINHLEKFLNYNETLEEKIFFENIFYYLNLYQNLNFENNRIKNSYLINRHQILEPLDLSVLFALNILEDNKNIAKTLDYKEYFLKENSKFFSLRISSKIFSLDISEENKEYLYNKISDILSKTDYFKINKISKEKIYNDLVKLNLIKNLN